MEKAVESVLTTPYWSVLPYRFGGERFVKYKLEPLVVPTVRVRRESEPASCRRRVCDTTYRSGPVQTDRGKAGQHKPVRHTKRRLSSPTLTICCSFSSGHTVHIVAQMTGVVNIRSSHIGVIPFA